MAVKRQSVASSILFLTIAEIFFNFSGYIIHAVLGRMLGPADYGRYALVVTLTTMVVMLIGNGIPAAMSKFLGGIFETDPGSIPIIKRKAAYLQLAIIGLVTLIFFLSAPAISWLLRDPTLTPLFRISSLILPSFAAASFYLYYFIGLQQFNLQSALKIIRSFARIIFVIGLAYLFGVKGSVAAYIIAPASVFVTAWIIDKIKITRELRAKKSELEQISSDSQKISSFNWRVLIGFAWPVTLFMLFYESLISLDLYFVKAILQDDRITGIYNASLTVARIPYYLFYALTLAMLPSISRVTTLGDWKEANSIISRAFRFMTIILAILSVLMISYAGPLIDLFYGEKFGESVFSTRILAPGAAFLTVFYVLSFALNGAGNVKAPMLIAFFGMIINAILNYFLVFRYGITGSALATSLTSVIIAPFILFYARKHFGSFISARSLSRVLVSASAVFAISLFLPSQNWTFLIYGLFLFLVYVIALILSGELKKSDWKLFTAMIKRER